MEFARYTFMPKHRPGLSMAHVDVDTLSLCHVLKETEKNEALLLSNSNSKALSFTIQESDEIEKHIQHMLLIYLDFKLPSIDIYL